jgi:hypothetical protein
VRLFEPGARLAFAAQRVDEPVRLRLTTGEDAAVGDSADQVA